MLAFAGAIASDPDTGEAHASCSKLKPSIRRIIWVAGSARAGGASNEFAARLAWN